MPVDRPRARSVDGHEVPLTSYTHFAVDDMLTQVMERMLAGVATRRHARTAEPGAGRAAAGLRTDSPHARRIVIAPARCGPLAPRNFDREFREGGVRIVRETGKPIAGGSGASARTRARWVGG